MRFMFKECDKPGCYQKLTKKVSPYRSYIKWICRRISYLEQIDPNFHWNSVQKFCLKEIFDCCKVLEENYSGNEIKPAELSDDVRRYMPSLTVSPFFANQRQFYGS